MMISRVIGSCAAVVCLLSAGSVVRADYEEEILSDEPVAFWRLGDDDVSLGAVNIGSGLDAINGTYEGDFLLEEAWLIFEDDDTAALFNGIDTEIRILRRCRCIEPYSGGSQPQMDCQ